MVAEVRVYNLGARTRVTGKQTNRPKNQQVDSGVIMGTLPEMECQYVSISRYPSSQERVTSLGPE